MLCTHVYDVLLRTQQCVIMSTASNPRDREESWRTKSWKEYNEIINLYHYARCHIQMGRVSSVESSWGVEISLRRPCLFMFTVVADTVAIATNLLLLRSSALLWPLASCFVLRIIIADFPRNIIMSIFVHQRSLPALKSSSGFPIVIDGRLQDTTIEGMNKCNINYEY